MRRLLFIALVFVGAFNTWAQKSDMDCIPFVSAPINIASEGSKKSFIAPSHSSLKSGSVFNSDFTVEFVNVPENAKSAFLYVLSIYESIIVSDIPVTVKFEWKTMGTNVLASSSPSCFYKNFTGALYQNIYYPVALAEKLAHRELNGTQNDIICTMNSDINWYFGTDGNCPSTQYDFVTVALHELVHGLGFSGFFNVENEVGDLANTSHLPSIYDWYVYKNTVQICDPEVFNMPSSQLKTVLESDDLSLKDNAGQVIEGIYAPKSWNTGSSIYHFNESGFEKEDANAIMSPYILKGEAIHYPGDKTLGILADLGWKSLSFEGTQIKDFDQEVQVLPVSVEVNGELHVDTTSVYFFYSKDNFVTTLKEKLAYNKNTRKFEGNVPVAVNRGTVQYYYSAKTTNNITYTYPENAPEKRNSFFVGTDYYPPVLKHNASKMLISSHPVLDLSAVATDNVGIKSVSIVYRVNGQDKVPVELKMQGTDLYVGLLKLPEGLSENDKVEYRVLAVDATERENKRYMPTSGYYTVEVCESMQAVHGYANSFDTYSDDFIVSDFSIDRPDGFSSGNLHTLSPYPESALENEKYNLIAQLKFPIILEENGMMTFDEVVLVEPGEEGTVYTEEKFWDFVIVEGSKDNGHSWLPVTEGYDSGADAMWNSHFANSLKSAGSEANGSDNLFLQQSINLTANAYFDEGDTVLFRFRLAADKEVNGWGWAIDNLVIQSVTTAAEDVLANEEVKIYPNPFQNSIYVDGVEANGADLDIIVTDLYGKTVFRETRYSSYDQKIQVDLPNIAPGIYLAAITDNQTISINQKIIKN